MAQEASITYTLTVGSTSVSKKVTRSNQGLSVAEITVPDSTTDMAVTFGIDISQLKLLFINSTKALTIQTNDGTTPDDTLVLVADEPVEWIDSSIHANPLTADVTTLYLTNASGASATFTIAAIQDATP